MKLGPAATIRGAVAALSVGLAVVLVTACDPEVPAEQAVRVPEAGAPAVVAPEATPTPALELIATAPSTPTPTEQPTAMPTTAPAPTPTQAVAAATPEPPRASTATDAPTASPTPTATPVQRSSEPVLSAVRVLDRLLNTSDGTPDPPGDCFHGDPTIGDVRADATIDTTAWLAGRLTVGDSRVAELFGPDGILACGREASFVAPAVICSGETPSAGEYLVVTNRIDAGVPLDDPGQVRTFWVMLASDDHADDFQALPQFANDVLGGSDVQFWLAWDGEAWSLRRTEGAQLTDTPTQSLALLGDHGITVLIPTGEVRPGLAGSLGALPVIQIGVGDLYPATQVGVAGYSAPLQDPFGSEATSDRAPDAQMPLPTVADVLAWELTFDGPPPAPLSAEASIRAEEGGTITLGSDESPRLTLEIPPGALGSDTTVSVRELSASEVSDRIRGVGPIGPVYEFGPDGLEFAVPAQVTVRVPRADLIRLGMENGAPMLFLAAVNGDRAEILESPVTVADLASGHVTVAAPLTHFSKLLTGHTPVWLDMRPQHAGRQPAGAQWQASVRLWNSDPKGAARVTTIAYKTTHFHPEVRVVGRTSVPGVEIQPNASHLVSPGPRYQCEFADSSPGAYIVETRATVRGVALEDAFASYFAGETFKLEQIGQLDAVGSVLCTDRPGGRDASRSSIDLIPALRFARTHIPIQDQLRIAAADECILSHWHVRQPMVQDVKGNSHKDPRPKKCGFGDIFKVKIELVPRPAWMS